MTGYTVHTGTSDDFASGWDRIFSGKKKTAAARSKSKKKTAAKRAGASKAKKRKS